MGTKWNSSLLGIQETLISFARLSREDQLSLGVEVRLVFLRMH